LSSIKSKMRRTLELAVAEVDASTIPTTRGWGYASRIRVPQLLKIAIALLIVANLAILPVASAGRKDAPIFFNDLLVGALLLAAAILALRSRRLVLDRVAVAALAFAAVGGFSAVLAIPRFDLSAFEFLFSIAYLFRWLAYFGIYVLVINYVRRTDVKPVWRVFEGMVLVFAAFGILQSMFLPGFAQIVYPESAIGYDWDDQGRRLVSTFLDPNFAGALILMPLLVLLARVSFGVPVPRWKLLLLFAALVLTVSRSSFLALVVGMVVIGCVRGLSRHLARFGILLGVLLLPFLPLIIEFAASFNRFAVDPSALTRVVSWLLAFQILADHPILGIGFNTFGFVREAYGSASMGRAGFTLDGGLLFIAVTTGLVGLTCYVTMLLLVGRRCRQVWRDLALSAEDRALGLGIAAVTLALVVHSIFLNSLLLPFLMEPLWVLWGLTFALREASSSGTISSTEPRASSYAVVALPGGAS
jgi:putative inorganic carbon (hco3(-)) transporter